jgi:two-component system, chemotaxis family, protein-glutamate methylesterase/glutaminase
MTPPCPIRVLIVDDSALVRKIVSESLARFPDIQVVGTAVDPYVARDRILELKPDVITLDIEMPRMDGVSFLKLIMQHRPMPVIIMSSLSQEGSEKALEVLRAGAVDIMPKANGAYSADADGSRLAEKIRAAAVSRVRRPVDRPAPALVVRPASPGIATQNPISKPTTGRLNPRQLILLGASTGGTEALTDVLTSMEGDLPGICIVQHIPASFSRAFANRLNQLCSFEVREAKQNDLVAPGLALVAPGGFHMVVKWTGSCHVVSLNQGPPVHHQRPAVDILFDSAVRAGTGRYCVAAVLTGMGADGAAGLLKLHKAGAQTIAQDEETCVVFGMPREAIRLGAAQQVLPLEKIGPRLAHLALNPQKVPMVLQNQTDK